MLDFTPQRKMLKVAIDLIISSGIRSPYAFGGGTALSTFYWSHRYSTDIDIFIYTKDEKKPLLKLRPSQWSPEMVNSLHSIGYGDEYKESATQFPGHYIEMAVNEYEKIQFFETGAFTAIPYIQGDVLGFKGLSIETVEEIIAKKLFYRADKANARDIFDIAVAIHKDPGIINTILDENKVNMNHLNQLRLALEQIVEDELATRLYKARILKMSPSREYSMFAENAPSYLFDIISTIHRFHPLDDNEMKVLEASSLAEYY